MLKLPPGPGKLADAEAATCALHLMVASLAPALRTLATSKIHDQGEHLHESCGPGRNERHDPLHLLTAKTCLQSNDTRSANLQLPSVLEQDHYPPIPIQLKRAH